ncbi:MAG: hypothetical protein ACLFWL_10885, partial [Candidatus Brocadiia bacterium]
QVVLTYSESLYTQQLDSIVSRIRRFLIAKKSNISVLRKALSAKNFLKKPLICRQKRLGTIHMNS